MKHILLAYDGTEPSKRALTLAAQLTKAYDASLSVVSVIPVHPGRAFIDPWDDPDAHAEQLLEARETLAANHIEAEFIEPVGRPAETIERVAQMGKFDSIVVGSRGLGSLERFLHGSVSEHLATHADATVVIAR